MTRFWRVNFVRLLGYPVLPLVCCHIRKSWYVGATAIASQMKSLTGILPKQWIFDMAFEFQDHLGIDGASWQYLVVNTFGFSGAAAYSMESTYLACHSTT